MQGTQQRGSQPFLKHCSEPSPVRSTALALSPVTHTCSATPLHTGTLLEKVDLTPLCTPLLSHATKTPSHMTLQKHVALPVSSYFLQCSSSSVLPNYPPQPSSLTEPSFSVPSFLGPSFSISICLLPMVSRVPHTAYWSFFWDHLFFALASTIADPLMNSKSRSFLNSDLFIHLRRHSDVHKLLQSHMGLSSKFAFGPVIPIGVKSTTIHQLSKPWTWQSP